MRRKSLLNLIFGLLLFAGIGISNVQAQVTLMQYTNQWSYLISNAMPAGWSASNYPAANGWPQGRGVLAFPLAEAMPAGVPAPLTVLATNYNNSTYVTSFYFRASITLTSNPNLLTIDASAVIDDGAVFYVNGREVQRVRMPPPPAVITYFTFANAGGEVNARPADTFAIASSNFVQGVNVIAAEVHQDAGTSSDVVFGLNLVATPGNPPVITAQPQSQTVEVGRNATFGVTATGSTPLTYRWYSNNVLVTIAGGGTTYTTPTTTLPMNGTTYYVTVSNRFGMVQSSNAVLTVELDDNGPKLILGVNTSTNQLEMTFDEPVLAGPATNRANWGVFMLGTTNPIAVTAVQFGTTRMRLTLDDTLELSSNYIVCAYNMQDAKVGRTNITPETCIGLSFPVTTNVIAFQSDWWYESLNTCLSVTNWMATNYNEADPNAFWNLGIATFFNTQLMWSTNLPPCVPLDGTSPFLGPRKFYFRKRFTLNTTFGTNVTAQLRHFVDDGAVFYLNGTELGRYMMPSGAINCDTLAQGGSPVTNATCQTLSVPINGNALLNIGTNNVLAVEVHEIALAQEIAGSDDFVFDAELTFVYRRTPTVPQLTVTRLGGNVILTWTGETNTWRVQRAFSISGPWTNMVSSPTQNRYQETRVQGPAQRFYRLGNP